MKIDRKIFCLGEIKIPIQNMKLFWLLCVSCIPLILATSYDFIVVGAGTAGSIVAAQLSSDPTYKVLVLDQGIDESSSPYTGPAFYGNFAAYVGTQQIGHYHPTTGILNGATSSSYNYLVPQVLGGASSENGGVFHRPSTIDLSRWNSSLWTFNSTNDDWKALETYVPGGNPTIHGNSGPITVNVFPPDNVLTTIMNGLMTEFDQPYNNDTNSGVDTGVGGLGRNLAVVNGTAVRQDTWTRVLRPTLNRTNVELLPAATVVRLELNSDGKHVVYYQIEGLEYHAKATKEVILCLGTFNSPRLLMLSGVGNCTYLNQLGIGCVYNNSGVGAIFRDTPYTIMLYTGPPPTTQSPGSIVGAKFAVNSPYPNMEVDAASIPLVPGLIQSYYFNLLHESELSLGSLTIRDNNPTSNPVVNINFYALNNSAIYDLVNVFKQVRALMATIPGTVEITPGTVYSPGVGAVPTSSTDSQIASYLMKAISGYHTITSTCALGQVVDERLRVVGVPGLRVIDNSIIPVKVTGHTCGWAMLIGQVGSRFVLEDWA